MNEYNFYDTSSLLLRVDDLFQQEENVIISSITFSELENIKTALNKDYELKYKASKLLKLLSNNKDKYVCQIFYNYMLEPFEKRGLVVNDDLRILATAYDYDLKCHPDETFFVTNDLSLFNIANLFFGDANIKSVTEEGLRNYKGYIDVELSEEEMADFYSHPNENLFNLLENQYINIYDKSGKLVDTSCWSQGKYRHLTYSDIKSSWFGQIKPFKDDPYQAMALDSFKNNDITMICGKPGSGKSYLALGYLFSELEKGRINKIIVFCNPVVARNAAKLGFYPGSRNEKILSSQVGNVLASKLGSMMEVEKLIEQEDLILIPAGDARGYEVPENSGVYILESQNLTCDLMRLLLQRVSENCKVIIDGDYNEQVDMDVYAGRNNGMKKVSEVFKGNNMFGQVELQKIHRSKIAELADLL